MPESINSPSSIALFALELFPPSVRRALISDRDFRKRFSLVTDADVLSRTSRNQKGCAIISVGAGDWRGDDAGGAC